MINNLSPIVLFVYNRPEHLKLTVEALRKNKLAPESDLIIYSDGPKAMRSEGEGQTTDDRLPKADDRIRKVRDYIRTINGFKSVTIIESPVNKGLANSVIDGVTEVVNQYGKIIVIEDDVLTSRFFLKYMNDSLNVYENCSDVLAIGSWNYFAPPQIVKSNFFLRIPDTIAWATYKRSWALFEKDAQSLLDKLHERNLIAKFNMDSTYGFDKMLQAQIAGRVSSWAIRWTAIAILNNKLTYFPQYSMTKHIGFDAASTHCADTDDWNKELCLAEIALEINNEKPVESEIAAKLWRKFARKQENKSTLLYNLIYFPKLLARRIVPQAIKRPIRRCLPWLI